MKYSQYNSIVRISDEFHVTYNALSDRFVILKEGMQQALDELPPQQLQQAFPAVYEELLNGGCIVKDEANETEALSQQIREIDNDPKSYALFVNPTLNCNFRCWYCYEEHIKGSNMKEEILKRTGLLMEHIAEHGKTLEHFNLAFFGGEPLLCFAKVVLPLMEQFNAVCQKHGLKHSISFTSNGYLITDKMIAAFVENGVGSLQITLDGCREAHDKVRFASASAGSYDTILDNIKKLLRNRISVILRINYTAHNIADIKNIVHDLKEITPEMKPYLRINFQRVWQDGDRDDIDEEVFDNMDAFLCEDFSVTKRDIDYVRNSCYADKRHQALVNYNGDVFKCTARDFKTASRDGYLDENGEIVWENDALEKRMNARFKNAVCHTCRIAPLCAGSCSQKTMEFHKNQCIFNYGAPEKDRVVLDRFVARYIH